MAALDADQELELLLLELCRLEGLYHAFAPEATPAYFEALVAPDFWEIGASGVRYERALCLQVLKEREAQPSADSWQVSEPQGRWLGADLCLLVYRLAQPGRVTMRSTVWRRGPQGWQAVFHQGTVLRG